MKAHLAARAAALGLKIVSGTCSDTLKHSTLKRGAISSAPCLPFLLPSNTPVLLRVVETLRTMDVDQIALVEIVAVAIAKGQL